MKKLLLTPLGLLALQHSYSQDSTAAIYINEYIEKMERHLQNHILEKKDTTINYGDSLKNVPLRVQTQFYTDPQTMQVEKIIEKSTYKNVTTEIIVYFRFNQPVRLTTIQKEGGVLKADFDVYYVNNNSVHYTKRDKTWGKPDGEELLVLCKGLLNDYNKMVEFQSITDAKPQPTNAKKGFSLFKKKKSG